MGRAACLATFLFGLFTLLVFQFYKIQVIEGDKWEQKALRQHQFSVNMPCKRGIFYASTPAGPRPLVVDVAKFHLFIDPDNLPLTVADEMTEMLAELLDADPTPIRAQFGKSSRSRRIATWVSRDRMASIDGWWKGFAKEHGLPKNALFKIQDWQRSYPYGSMLGQVLHTVRENKAPTGGLELYYDKQLRGEEGKKILSRSPRHSLTRDQIIQEPRDGEDVYLTIDPVLQAICEEEIAKAVDRVHAKGGWAIMMDPFTGEIMALAQYPFFEPANYASYYNDRELIERTKVKAITDCFEPGSTMKPLTVTLALLANEELAKRGEPPLFLPDEKIRADDGLVPGTRHRIKDVRQHRFLNMELALVKSSNVYMGKLVERICARLGEQWYRDQLENVFGLSHKTGIELPSEARGMLPTPGKLYRGGQLQWSKPTPYTLAIGYNLLTTSLQMVRAFAIIANGGFDVRPTLTKQSTLGERKLPAGISEQLIRALRYVTKPGGSSSRADVRGYTEAGKSGTSEKIKNGKYSKKDHFSSFVGFTPARHARFVLFIGIDEPIYKYIPGYGKTHYGGKCAAPVFKEISQRALAYLGVPPDDPHGYPVGDPRYDPDKADSAKEVRALKELYQKWND